MSPVKSESGDIEYFDTTLDGYKFTYRDKKFDYFTQCEFDSIQVIILYVNF